MLPSESFLTEIDYPRFIKILLKNAIFHILSGQSNKKFYMAPCFLRISHSVFTSHFPLQYLFVMLHTSSRYSEMNISTVVFFKFFVSICNFILTIPTAVRKGFILKGTLKTLKCLIPVLLIVKY